MSAIIVIGLALGIVVVCSFISGLFYVLNKKHAWVIDAPEIAAMLWPFLLPVYVLYALAIVLEWGFSVLGRGAVHIARRVLTRNNLPRAVARKKASQ